MLSTPTSRRATGAAPRRAPAPPARPLTSAFLAPLLKTVPPTFRPNPETTSGRLGVSMPRTIQARNLLSADASVRSCAFSGPRVGPSTLGRLYLRARSSGRRSFLLPSGVWAPFSGPSVRPFGPGPAAHRRPRVSPAVASARFSCVLLGPAWGPQSWAPWAPALRARSRVSLSALPFLLRTFGPSLRALGPLVAFGRLGPLFGPPWPGPSGLASRPTDGPRFSLVPGPSCP